MAGGNTRAAWICALAVDHPACRRRRQNETRRHSGRRIARFPTKTGAELYLPIVPELALAMKAYSAKGLALIGAENGKPLTRPGLSEFMARAIEQAGLPAKCVSHGLRKAGMRRMAEAGFTEKQIAAWSGHKTLRKIER